MLRTLVFAPMALFGFGAPAVAAAEDFPRAAVGKEVHADDGTVIGHVTAATRDRSGSVTSVEIPGLEPPDASSLRGTMVAEDDRDAREVPVIDMRPRAQERVDETNSHERASLH